MFLTGASSDTEVMSQTGADLLHIALQRETASGRDEFSQAVKEALGVSGDLDPQLGVSAHLFVNTESSRQAYILCSGGLLLVEWSPASVFTSSVPLFRVVGLNTVTVSDEVGESLLCTVMLDTGLRTTSSGQTGVTEFNSMQFRAREDLREEAEDFVAELRNAMLGVWG